MNFYELKNISAHEIIPGFFAKYVHGEHTTTGYVEIKAGSVLPEHQHMHEQVTVILEGRFEFTVGNETTILEAGKIAVIPPFTNHSGKTITDCRVLDFFYPVREDYK